MTTFGCTEAPEAPGCHAGIECHRYTIGKLARLHGYRCKYYIYIFIYILYQEHSKTKPPPKKTETLAQFLGDYSRKNSLTFLGRFGRWSHSPTSNDPTQPRPTFHGSKKVQGNLPLPQMRWSMEECIAIHHV